MLNALLITPLVLANPMSKTASSCIAHDANSFNRDPIPIFDVITIKDYLSIGCLSILRIVSLSVTGESVEKKCLCECILKTDNLKRKFQVSRSISPSVLLASLVLSLSIPLA